jgi:hypothetical protein
VIDPPAFEKVVAFVPGVTDVAGTVVVVVAIAPDGDVTVEVTGAVVVVVEVTTMGVWRVDGNVVVVTADSAWRRMAEFEGVLDGPVDGVSEGHFDVVGTLQVVIAPGATGDELAARAAPGAGMTGSGGAAIDLVTAPTPTHATVVAAAVATSQAATGSGVIRRIQRFCPSQQHVRTKAMIIRGHSSYPEPQSRTRTNS